MTATTYYELFGLTPFRAALVHLFLIGIPFRYGLLPTRILLQDWFLGSLRLAGHLDEAFGLQSPSARQPCSIFAPLPPSSSSSSSSSSSHIRLEKQDNLVSISPTQNQPLYQPDNNNNNDHNNINESPKSEDNLWNLCTSETEVRAVFDMGSAFLEQYLLTWFIFWVLWRFPQRREVAWKKAWLDFHRVSVVCTLISLMVLTFVQKTHPPVFYQSLEKSLGIRRPPSELWNAHFFTSFLFYNLVALTMSLWTLLTPATFTPSSSHTQTTEHHPAWWYEWPRHNPQPPVDTYNHFLYNINNNNQHHVNHYEDEFMKWSIPANAIFCGAVSCLFTASAKIQALYENPTRNYYPPNDSDGNIITPRIPLSLGVQAFYHILQAIWLFQIRSFLTMSQLRQICVYQALCQAMIIAVQILPQSTNVQIPWTWHDWILHCTLFGIPLLGFLWAGLAEGFSTILTSEREDDFSSLRKSVKRD